MGGSWDKIAVVYSQCVLGFVTQQLKLDPMLLVNFPGN